MPRPAAIVHSASFVARAEPPLRKQRDVVRRCILLGLWQGRGGESMRSKFVTGKRSGRADSVLIAAAAVAASVSSAASSAWGQALSLPSFGSTVYNVTVSNPSINNGVAA